MNLVPLACLLEHPSWRLVGLVEAAVARQLDGGSRGERAGRGEEASRLRQARHIGPGGECCSEEVARGGSTEVPVGDEAWSGGEAEWVGDGHDDVERKQRSEHRAARTR